MLLKYLCPLMLFSVTLLTPQVLLAADFEQLPASDQARIKVSTNKRTGNVTFLTVTGNTGLAHNNGRRPGAPEAATLTFLSNYGLEFGVTSTNPLAELKLANKKQNANNRSKHTLKYTQNRNGIPIFGAEIIVRLDDELKVTGANGKLSSSPVDYVLSRQTKVGKDNALDVISKNKRSFSSAKLSLSAPKRYIYNAAILGNGPDQERPANLYRVSNARGDVDYTVLIDAETNAVLTYFSNIQQAKNRTIHDQVENFTLPVPSGNIVRSEGDAPYGLADVDNAYDFSGDTYDFLLNEHGRDSLDDAGLELISAVRYCEANSCPTANAFWDPNISTMIYGTGFAVDDVVAHEIVHGFTSFTSNLIYQNESGAINESLSDIWGEWVDLGNNAGNDSAGVRWLLGEDLPSIVALRNLQDPPAFGHPDRVGSGLYYCGTQDNGGVHWNSGVNNKAAVLMTDGGTFNGQTVNALGISKTADIYYQAQVNYLTQSSGYNDLYNALNSSCNDLIGTGGITAADCTQVDNALLAVEMDAPVCPTPPLVAYCPADSTKNSTFSDDFESGNLANWTVNNLVGTNNWVNANNNPFSGTRNLHADNPTTTTDSALEMSNSFLVLADTFLAFDHIANLELNYDGGVVEFSTNGGSTWTDLLTSSPLVDGEYYAGNLLNTPNPLSGREAFFGRTDYRRTKVALPTSAVGSNMSIRFRVGTDTIVGSPGWDIDNVDIYQCSIPAPGKTCAGLPVTVDLGLNEVPTTGNDVIWGTTGPDVIYALDGNDVVCGLSGADTIYGGDGYDRLYGGAGTDTLYGGNSIDDLYGGTGDDTLYGGTSSNDSDYLYGQNGNDILFDQNGYGSAWGGNGSDTIYAGADGAYAEGGLQPDTMYGSTGPDHFLGQTGWDILHGFGGNDSLYGGKGDDTINGGSGADYAEGGSGNDTITGGGGVDTLLGGPGSDTILGGTENDALSGGNGNDALNGQGQTDSCNGGLGTDTAVNCESTTSVPLQANRSMTGLLPSVRPSLHIIELLDDCDETIFECLTPAQQAKITRR